MGGAQGLPSLFSSGSEWLGEEEEVGGHLYVQTTVGAAEIPAAPTVTPTVRAVDIATALTVTTIGAADHQSPAPATVRTVPKSAAPTMEKGAFLQCFFHVVTHKNLRTFG